MSEKKEILMHIDHLSKDYRIKNNTFMGKDQMLHALSDVTLDVYRGETLGIVGESGCGKSTLGRLIVQLTNPTKGSVNFNGVDIFSQKGKDLKKVKKEMQMVFQDPYSSLNSRKTCGSIIGEPLIVHKITNSKKEYNEKVISLMQNVGLDVQYINRYPHEFSGGQRQRINIARVLSMNPSFIVCDEPVSALDVSIQAQILNLFNKLQKENNLTYLFISHDLGIVKHVSDRIVIMYLGLVVEFCDAVELYSNPMHPYTKALLSAIPPESPFNKVQRIKLKGEIPSSIGDLIGCPLSGRCPYTMERCKTEIPLLENIGNNHKVACFLYKKQEV
ncbi:MAG: ATP-binding cassette domain-containing protein [Peptostreptococcaceae bacterium]|nr:ATP-binding cassette domain-containing protein [Peptostreptococcaceae bacterium]